jgi:hypothetical protein
MSFRVYPLGLMIRASKNYAGSALPKGLVASAAASPEFELYLLFQQNYAHRIVTAFVSGYRELPEWHAVHMRSTLPNSSDCMPQLSKRYILPDSCTDWMSQWVNAVERFGVLRFRQFLPNARLQSDVASSVCLKLSRLGNLSIFTGSTSWQS